MTGLFDDTMRASAAPADRPDPLEGLNARQREAVEHEDGPLIVLAGPGTGKTRVIIARIAHMIAHRGIDPASILALTFTNKAAGEMRERLAAMLDPVTAERVNAYTFNGFGAHLLRRFGDLAGLPPEPGLIDSAQRKRMLRRIVDERGLFRHAVVTGLETAIRNAAKRIDAMHCAGFTVESARGRLNAIDADTRRRLEEGGDAEVAESLRARAHELAILRETVDLWEGFDAACLAEGVLSFDHQVAWTNRLLDTKAMARDLVRDDYRHIVVDEYQDVNAAQIDLLRLLAPPDRHAGRGPDLCVVGDDDQAIYGFRGSDDRAFLRFERIWTTAQTVMLEENYRSASCVLGRAAAIIGRAHDRFREDKVIRRPDAAGDEPAGAGVEAIRLDHYMQADEVIAAMIREGLRTNPEIPPCEYAVIVRNTREGDRIRRSLELEGFRVQARRSSAPTADDGVLDVLAWIDLLLNPRHTWSARRIMLRPPFQMEVALVTALESRYARLRSDAAYRARRGREGQEPPAFLEWAAGLLDGGGAAQREAIGVAIAPPQASILSRLIGMWRDLSGPAQTAAASAVIGEIVRRTDVVHNELLDGRARAARVSAVVGMIRFAAERADRLAEPGDLRAFMEYYEDLDASEQTLRDGGLSHEGSDEDEADPAAVQVLTAHGSKGLEFDTVFLPRIESQHGYPGRDKGGEEEELPAWMVEDDGRPEVEREADEERRLFYVACTRAERRLVYLGKVSKSRPKGVNYFWELLDELLDAVVREAGEVLGPHPRDGAEREAGVLDWGDQVRRREAVRSARRIARLEAAGLLERAGAADEAGYADIARGLAACARRMAAISAGEAGLDCPDWIDDADLRTLHAALRSEEPDSANASAADAVIRAVKGPLTLSYTAIRAYHECPRCYFVGSELGLPQPETTPIVTGTVVHKALEEFYRPLVKGREGEPGRSDLEHLLALGEAAFEDACRGVEVPDESQREQIAAMLRQYYDWMHARSGDVAHVEHRFEFVYSRRGAHRIKGKIDRIDFDGAAYRIIDYKTGHPSQNLLEPGSKDHQLGIYLMAMRAWLNNGVLDGSPVPVGSAAYWLLKTNQRGEVGFDDIAAGEEKTREWIDEAIDGMLDGEFPRGRGCSGLCSFLEPGCSAD